MPGNSVLGASFAAGSSRDGPMLSLISHVDEDGTVATPAADDQLGLRDY